MTREEINKLLDGCSISVQNFDDDAYWLMTCSRGKSVARVIVKKSDVAAENVHDHARMTFANMLQNAEW